MIPTTRPVIGRDLDTIKRALGLSTADACNLFGLSITKWTDVVRTNADSEVRDPTLALLTRFLDEHMRDEFVPRPPTCEDFFDLLKSIDDRIDQKRFSVLVGSEGSAAYRWLRIGSRPTPALSRLMLYMKIVLDKSSRAGQRKFLEDWMLTVVREGAARGVDNVLRTGRWAPESAANDERMSSPEGRAEDGAPPTPAREAGGGD